MDAIWKTLAAYTPPTMTFPSWRALAVLFALANLKSLHFMWFVRPPPLPGSLMSREFTRAARRLTSFDRRFGLRGLSCDD